MIPALRDVALIILAVQMMICLLVPGAIVFGGVWLMRRANMGLRPKMQSVHRSLREVELRVDQVGQRIADPFIRLETRWVTIQTFLRGLWRERMKP
jgi:hypothetical protein